MTAGRTITAHTKLNIMKWKCVWIIYNGKNNIEAIFDNSEAAESLAAIDKTFQVGCEWVFSSLREFEEY